MKSITFLFLVLLLSACSSTQLTVQVPARQSVEIDYPNYALYEADINNKTSTQVDVAVISKESSKQVRGFGLGSKAQADVLVEKGNKLVISNTNYDDTVVKIAISEMQLSSDKQTGEYITFTLRNKSAKSIPLIIPTVMNPNLSPFSNSGVSLKIGQEIIFKEKGKRYVLLIVDNTIAEGDVIEVSRLLKERKEALGL